MELGTIMRFHLQVQPEHAILGADFSPAFSLKNVDFFLFGISLGSVQKYRNAKIKLCPLSPSFPRSIERRSFGLARYQNSLLRNAA